MDSTAALALVTHILCCSCGMYFSAAASSENEPGQHELGLEHGPATLNHSIKSGRHPAQDWMLHVPLNVRDHRTGVALVPEPVQVLRNEPELDDEVGRQVLGFRFAPFLAPEAEQGFSSTPMMVRASEPQ